MAVNVWAHSAVLRVSTIRRGTRSRSVPRTLGRYLWLLCRKFCIRRQKVVRKGWAAVGHWKAYLSELKKGKSGRMGNTMSLTCIVLCAESTLGAKLPLNWYI